MKILGKLSLSYGQVVGQFCWAISLFPSFLLSFFFFSFLLSFFFLSFSFLLFLSFFFFPSFFFLSFLLSFFFLFLWRYIKRYSPSFAFLKHPLFSYFAILKIVFLVSFSRYSWQLSAPLGATVIKPLFLHHWRFDKINYALSFASLLG